MKNLKLYTWHCDLFGDPARRIMLFAIADDETNAKNQILEYVKDESHKAEIAKYFNTKPNPPSVYSEPSAFIMQGCVQLLL